MWSKDRLITAAILGVAAAIMLTPLAMNWFGRDIALVQNLGFSPGTLAPARAWLAALAFAVGYIVLTFRAIPSVRRHQSEISLFKLIGVAAAFASGIMEEVVFRRWLMDAAMVSGVGEFGQVLLSGVVFGLAHLVWHAFSRDWRFSLAAAISTTVAGMALAIIYLMGGRNLGLCIAAHMLINLVIEPWLVLSAVTGSDRETIRRV